MNRLINSPYFGRSLKIILRPSMASYSSSKQFEARFKAAQKNMKKLDDFGSDLKLKMYGLYKQATIGVCNTPKPSVFNIIDKAKWESWNSLGSMSTDEAMDQYAKVIEDLLRENGISVSDASDGHTSDSVSASGGSEGLSSGGSEGLLIEKVNSVFWIKLNRPKKFNAITSKMYDEIISALNDAANDTSIKFAVITGTGDYYSSGNDLSNFQTMLKEFGGDFRKGATEGSKILQKFVASFIDFPKPLIGAVNGPAIGIAVTTLGLMDYVIASDKATFYTPFSALGQSPEGCATLMFPKIMGQSRASQMLLFNHTMTAKEAYECGFVSKLIPSAQFETHLREWLYGDNGVVKSCYPKTMMVGKGLMLNSMRPLLHERNKLECETIIERWCSDECAEALQKFFTRKSNL